MIGETGWLRKNKSTNLPIVFEVNGVEGLTKKSIDMHIGHDRSVGGLFLKYNGGFCVKW